MALDLGLNFTGDAEQTADLAEYRKQMGLPEVLPANAGIAPVQGQKIILADPKLPAYKPEPLLGQEPGEPQSSPPTVTPPVTTIAKKSQEQPSTPSRIEQTEAQMPLVETPEIKKEREENAQLRQEQIKQLQISNAAQADAADFSAAIAQQTQAQADKQAAIDQAEAQRIKEQAAAADKEWQSKRADYNANRTVDPDKYWKDKGVGSHILAAIAEGLGAFGSAMTGGPNYAMQIVNRAVDANIKAQEDAIAGRRDAMNDAYNAVQHYRQMGMSHESAVRAARVDLWERTARKIQTEVAPYSNKDIQARGQAMIAGAMAQANNEQIAEQQSNQARFVKKFTTAPAAQPTVEDRLRIKALEVQVPQSDPATGRETGTMTVYAPSADEAKNVREAQRVAGQMKRNLAVMRGLVKTTSQAVTPAAKERVERLYNKIREDEGVLAGLGALSRDELVLTSMLGDPTSLFQRDKTTLKLIDDAVAGIDSRINEHYKSLGWTQ